jgi:hypothetical protein
LLLGFAIGLFGAGSARAALFDVQSLSIDTASFDVVSAGPSPDGTNFQFFNTNLVAGAGNPIFTFFLVDPFNPTNQGVVTTYTTAASPAFVNTATNQFTIALPTFTMDWNTGPYPSLCTIKPCVQPQGPQAPQGAVTGDWNPATQRFAVSWTYAWGADQHPFPSRFTTWTLGGVATPVPEPSVWALFAAGLALLGFIARKRMP